ARHDVSVPGVHVSLQGKPARPLARSRLPVRRLDVHVHPRGDRGDVAARRARPRGRGPDAGLLRTTLRRGAEGTPPPEEPLALAEFPDGPKRELALPQ